MAQKKTRSRSTKTTSIVHLKQIPFARSYTSLLYGVVTVFVLFLLIIFGVRVLQNRDQGVILDEGANIEEALSSNERMYLVKEGDTLWSISEKEYDTGFEWKRIADANQLTSPDSISAGDKLMIPEKSSATTGQLPKPTVDEGTIQTPSLIPPTTNSPTISLSQKIDSTSYTVMSGDTLWEVAVRAYGDGYKWVDIARANKLVNPDIIHSGNKLTIPR